MSMFGCRVKNALGMKTLLSTPSVLAALLALEEEFGKLSPLNTVAKLKALADRFSSLAGSLAGSTPVVLWIIEGLAHLFRSGVREFSEKSIFGEKKAEQPGWADLLTLKKELLVILLDKLDGTAPGVRPKLESHSAFREHFVAKGPAGEETDRSWVGLLPHVARLQVGFIEDCIYGKELDTSMRNALHEKTAASAFLETEEVCLRLVPVEGPAGPPMEVCPSAEEVQADEMRSMLSSLLPDVDLDKLKINSQQLHTLRQFRTVAHRSVHEDCRLLDGSLPAPRSDPQPSRFAKITTGNPASCPIPSPRGLVRSVVPGQRRKSDRKWLPPLRNHSLPCRPAWFRLAPRGLVCAAQPRRPRARRPRNSLRRSCMLN